VQLSTAGLRVYCRQAECFDISYHQMALFWIVGLSAFSTSVNLSFRY